MTTEQYYKILEEKYRALGKRPTREQLHEYNQFKEELRKELCKEDKEKRNDN